MKTTRINREDMLELTRRMTVQRNCFGRIAGAYMDEDGEIDGTFNTHFLKLGVAEKEKNLAIAKAIPFAPTNENLKEYKFEKDDEVKGSTWQALMGLVSCELKNDALLEVFYEMIGERYHSEHPYAIYFFHGNYDIPLKGSDKEQQWESEEVYQFVICAICPIIGDYEPGEPECGFLFPAFGHRSSNIHGVDVFQANTTNPHDELVEKILF